MDSKKEQEHYKKLLLIDKNQLNLELRQQANRVALFGAKGEMRDMNYVKLRRNLILSIPIYLLNIPHRLMKKVRRSLKTT